MTLPTRPVWPPVVPFCSRCEFHLATTTEPLCPVCLDDEKKETKR